MLLHVAAGGRALAEARRGMKQRGLVARRDLILDFCLGYADLGMMRRSIEAFIYLVAADGGQPSIARDIKRRLQDARFTDISVAHFPETYSSPDELEFFHTIVRQWFPDGGIADAAQKYGAMPEEMKLPLRGVWKNGVRVPALWLLRLSARLWQGAPEPFVPERMPKMTRHCVFWH